MLAVRATWERIGKDSTRGLTRQGIPLSNASLGASRSTVPFTRRPA